MHPRYVVRVYNRYGYLLGSDKVGGGWSGYNILEPGDVGGERVNLDLVDIAGVFRHTGLVLPKDFFEASWLSLSACNTKLAEQDDKPNPLPAK